VLAVVTGAAFLQEKIAAAPLDLAAEGLSLAVTIGGIIALAQRAPHAAGIVDSPGTPAPARATTAIDMNPACRTAGSLSRTLRQRGRPPRLPA
jgi:hypothetical protein